MSHWVCQQSLRPSSGAAQTESKLLLRDESTGIVGDMPKVFAGKQVVNGDYYDIRFLDELMKEDPNQGVIVGLSFKQPTNINIPIGAGHEINPLSAIVFKQQQSVCILILDCQ